MADKNTLLIIDGYGFVFRAFHVQPLLTSPEGRHVGAVYGFTAMLLKILSDFKPSHAVVVFDSGKSNFRHALYSDYKANRPPAPQELIEQFNLVRTAASSLNFSILEVPGFEADDIIATLATKACEVDEEVVIISSDKDLMQLINSNVKMYDPVKSKYIQAEDVVAKFGVEPARVREVMALIGDSSDNIPGVQGIGPKTAAELIKQFGSLDKLLSSIDQVKSERLREILESSRERAHLSWKLVGLDREMDLALDLDSLKWQAPEAENITNFLHQHGFKSLYKRIEQLFDLKITAKQNIVQDFNENYETIKLTDKASLVKVLNQAREKGEASIYLVQQKNIAVAIILSFDKKNYWVEISQEQANKQGDFFSKVNQVDADLWFKHEIYEFLKDKAVKKITFNLKTLMRFFGSEISSCDDIELMQYTISAGLAQNDLFSEVIKAANTQELILIHAQIVGGFAARFSSLTSELKANNALSLYREIDLPLCYTIHKMESAGIKVDLESLKQLSEMFGIEIAKLEQQIYASCGQEFNIGSPKQLGEILFEKMQLPHGKLSGKSKAYSTGADVLDKLSEKGFNIADLLLRWRGLAKLKNTYTDSLQNHIDSKTCRIHSTFLQTSTTTGRLSSNEPNLQNIPIRSVEGNKIRGVFIAENGNKLISADYSQIELRILSHIANISTLKEAFINGDDIHSGTAQKIFKIDKNELTHEHRRKAKAINFGIIYGISSFGLAKQLNIPASEASDYIDRYFKEYPGIKEYMETTKAFAHANGYVENLYGRKCYVPFINDKNHNLRHFAERAAINAPIQGSNADIIKIAMININKIFKQNALNTKLILQIHDELLFEAPEAEVETVLPIIKQAMEKATNLSVPLTVEANVGNNWMEIH